ncbi:hypothetical protein [Kribbella sp. NPDC004536]|uniref:hypothetical protein n=1 Tax=Kribbella sp. NPDC004536 TaxID=3364106 RepID=UPI0036C82B9A
MPDSQQLANLALMSMLILLPLALGTMLYGRSRGTRRVLTWARALALATLVLTIAYDVAGAVVLLLIEPTPGHPPWTNPALATKYPYFYLPIGVGAFLAALGVLVGVIRARHKLG